MAAFEAGEYRERASRVSAAMARAGIDVLVGLRESNLCYLTGYEGYSDYVPQAVILRQGDPDPILLLREMDLHCAIPTVYLDEQRIEVYRERYIGTSARSPWDVIGARVAEIAGRGRIGVELEATGFSVPAHAALCRALGGRTVVDASDVVARAKIRKSPRELGYMREAGVIVDRALKAGMARMAEGVRQCDVAAAIMAALAEGTPEFGGGYALPGVTMPMTPAAAAPHLKWTNAPYRAGSQTNFELGGFRHRYCCALSRTVVLGTPPAHLRRVHDAVQEGFAAALAAVRPGATCGDVYQAFARAFFPHGIRKESRIGYSIGLDWSDLCFSLQADDPTVLETDYTMHMIIGIWEKNEPYVFSETIRVAPSGGESLSGMPRHLLVQ